MKKFFGTCALIAGLAVSTIASGFSTSTQNGYFVNLDAVPQIVCAHRDDKGVLHPIDSGSSSIIGHDRVLTAAHVIHGTDVCQVKGHLTTVVYENDALDVAVLQADLGDTPVMPISCDSFVAAHMYFAIGYAQGQDFALQLITATGKYLDIRTDTHMFTHGATFEGRVFPGMSGGPVVDGLGRVTGVIVAGSERAELTAIRDLADTPLCEMLKAKE